MPLTQKKAINASALFYAYIFLPFGAIFCPPKFVAPDRPPREVIPRIAARASQPSRGGGGPPAAANKKDRGRNRRQKMMEEKNTELINNIRRAMSYLAARCDYAVAADGAGFSAGDTLLGHALATKEKWSDRELWAAALLAVKYQKQLISVIQLNLTAIKALLDSRPKESRRLTKRDIITGRIWIESDRLLIQTGYHTRVVETMHQLIGARWEKESKTWSADCCAENVADVEALAAEFALTLEKTTDWDNYRAVRQISIAGNEMIISGINSRRVRELINPEDNIGTSNVSFGCRYPEHNSFAIPLNSWSAAAFALWLQNLDDGNHLSWAVNGSIDMMSRELMVMRKREQELYNRSISLKLCDDERNSLFAALPPDFAGKLMPHQWVAINAITEFKQIILADQQGLGKTIEILGGLEATKAYPAIIVAPATALLTWRDEVANWLPNRKVAVLGGKIAKADTGSPLEQADIVILNYEMFVSARDRLATIRPATLVADEAQYLKGHDSARTKAVVSFCRDYEINRIIAATGTPLMNRPSELLSLLTLLPQMLLELGGFWHFARRYCAAEYHYSVFNSFWDFSGSANLGELANRLRETGRFIRREKAEVLPDLPAKQQELLNVAIENRDEYETAKSDFAEWLRTKIKPDGKKKRRDEESTQLQLATACLGIDNYGMCIPLQQDRADALRRLTALRQLVGRGKIAAALSTVRKVVMDEKQKIVVFAYHLEVQNALIEALTADGQKPLSITGDMPPSARNKAICRFQTDPGEMIIVCSLKAAQTAITLTAAHRALFAELDWVPGTLDQAEDRIHRIGQSDQVMITYLVGHGTIDERMSDVLFQKRSVVNKISNTAQYGYRKDGKPRMQAPGPGRKPLPPAERKANRAKSKAIWQSRNLDAQREKMRARRAENSSSQNDCG
jgi:SWI/SNF-related matrix-associated actin-dependent regulator of chromatin subfamily A-like protein 1